MPPSKGVARPEDELPPSELAPIPNLAQSRRPFISVARLSTVPWERGLPLPAMEGMIAQFAREKWGEIAVWAALCHQFGVQVCSFPPSLISQGLNFSPASLFICLVP